MDNYDNHISDNVKQRDLNGADPFNCLQEVPKSSDRKKHRVEAIKITSHYQGPVVCYWFWHCPRDYSQREYRTEKVEEDGQVKNVPAIPERKTDWSHQRVKIDFLSSGCEFKTCMWKGGLIFLLSVYPVTRYAWLINIIYSTHRFHLVVRVSSDNAQMTSKGGKNKEVRCDPRIAWLTFLPGFDVLCALSECTRTAK